MERVQWGGGGVNGEGDVHGIRSKIGMHKIDMGRLRVVQETEKPKNLYVHPWEGRGMLEGREVQGGGGIKERKKIRKTVIA